MLDELRAWVGLPVRQAWVTHPTQVVLAIGPHQLLIESHPLPRIHPTSHRPKSPGTPFSFQGLLRSRFSGLLTSVRGGELDRVVELEVGAVVLHARLFGRGGGIWLLDHGRVVAASTGPSAEQLPPLLTPREDPRPPRFQPGAEGRWGEAAAAWFQEAARREADERLRQRLGAHLTRLAAKETRLVSNLGLDLDATARAGHLRAQADALAATLHLVARGTSLHRAPDPGDPDTVLEIRIDPARPPSETLNKLYDKAGRLDRAIGPLVDRIAAAEERLRALPAAREHLAQADHVSMSELARTWKLPDHAPRSTQAPGVPWWTWEGPNAERLLVGKHAQGNHALVFRHARGRDWWVHVQGKSGAHVVVPWSRTDVPPPSHVLQAAAALALLTSHVPAGEVEGVLLARVRDVRAVPGAGPGRVTVSHERTWTLTATGEPPPGWQRVDPP